MTQDYQDPDAAAARLAAALERIAHNVSVLRNTPPADPPPASPQTDADLSIPQIADRLDSLISRLRTALGKPD